MSKNIYFAAIGLVLFLAGLPMRTSAQEYAGFTFLTGASGPMVCLGKWLPSTDPALPGRCEGQLMDMGQFSASSARMSADRLDQVINILVSIDQRLSVNNDQLQHLVTAAANVQKSIDSQALQGSLSEAIEKRFNSLPGEILSNDLFKQEITKLKGDILKEVERRNSTSPSTTAK
jgi:hypothetical protein